MSCIISHHREDGLRRTLIGVFRQYHTSSRARDTPQNKSIWIFHSLIIDWITQLRVTSVISRPSRALTIDTLDYGLYPHLKWDFHANLTQREVYLLTILHSYKRGFVSSFLPGYGLWRNVLLWWKKIQIFWRLRRLDTDIWVALSYAFLTGLW